MSRQVARSDLLHLYKRLLRLAEVYPSKNRDGIYSAIRDEFRLNRTLEGDKAHKEIQLAYQGLGQLQQFDGRKGTANFSVTLEQNPFPKPDGADEKRPGVSDGINRLAEERAKTDSS
eukprot:CAMPEP_0198118324 /NCGR_PEP_ID=MMETSP1442-20131203/21187_1 /TAXON_ID= /ORGANISM="Craspedostauros australis, Strain CCMP3328" /LENGTH=116 /DNA_ID=CAMNT_0043776559 /DNA_START=90 /DNA_END=440 /DNA_ORIENTATION=+